jgi:hypothetical protein
VQEGWEAERAAIKGQQSGPGKREVDNFEFMGYRGAAHQQWSKRLGFRPPHATTAAAGVGPVRGRSERYRRSYERSFR